MIIDLTTISQDGRSFDFCLEKDWWHSKEKNDQILGFDSSLKVKLKIYKAGDKYLLEGDLSGGLQVVCDRCLNAYHRDLRYDFNVFLDTPPIPDTNMTEVELLDEDMEVDFIKDREIDLDEIIREQIYLSLPMKSLCSDKCPGLCPICGSNLNVGDCQCHREQGHPGFLKLKDLKIE
jgi:uncharacterized protein